MTRMSFDGQGINFVGGYAERVATLSEQVKKGEMGDKIGRMLAASPEMFSFMKQFSVLSAAMGHMQYKAEIDKLIESIEG